MKHTLDGSEYRIFIPKTPSIKVNQQTERELVPSVNSLTISANVKKEDSLFKLFSTHKKQRRLNKKKRIEAFARNWGVPFSLARKMLIKSTQNTAEIKFSMYELKKAGVSISFGES